MKGRPPSSPTSWMVTMLEWLMAEAARASCANRSFAPTRRSRSAAITFSATSRSSRGS